MNVHAYTARYHVAVELMITVDLAWDVCRSISDAIPDTRCRKLKFETNF